MTATVTTDVQRVQRKVKASAKLTADQYENPYEYADVRAYLAQQIRTRLDRINVAVASGTFTTSVTRDGESVVATTVWEN